MANDELFDSVEVMNSVTEYLRCETPLVTVEQVSSWLREPPELTVVRINTWKSNIDQVKEKVEEHLLKTNQRYCVSKMEGSSEVLLIKSVDKFKNEVEPAESEVIVDAMCGGAVLRGADVFTPGILSIHPPTNISTIVSVWADLEGKCLKGWNRKYDGKKTFVGNGEILVSRDQVFREGQTGGVGVRMTERLYNCPSLDDRVFGGLIYLQNLPSILAVHHLDPQPHERVLDMCAAPGGKSLHIATRMENKGYVACFDKSEVKKSQIQRNANTHGLTIIHPYKQDARKSVSPEAERGAVSPPFPGGTFDRVLLDAPCSALGQRPQFVNHIQAKELASFSRLQKQLFEVAVEQVKPGGTLVYSTCTLAATENENILTWAHTTFKDLQPVVIDEVSGKNYLRYGHPLREGLLDDTIGFFVAKFMKIK